MAMIMMKRNGIYIKSKIIVLSLLCATGAHANVYGKEVVRPASSLIANVTSPLFLSRVPPRGVAGNVPWLASTQFSTTLRLTQNGIATSGADVKASASPAIAFLTAAWTAAAAPLDGQANAIDSITTVTIPTATATAGAATAQFSRTIRPDLPLFGAHRIRFGKIGSGGRIAGLIRKAAASGSSAICINQCAELADSLALEGASVTEQLRHISANVNRMVAYRTDADNYGRVDQWSTPNETLGRASGDCEDYAIVKMALLARLGVPVNAMEIVVLKDTSRRLFHAVLSVAVGNRSLILDNVTDAVEADTAKPDYAPLFSLSGSANFVFSYKGGKPDLVASLKNIATIAPGAGF